MAYYAMAIMLLCFFAPIIEISYMREDPNNSQQTLHSTQAEQNSPGYLLSVRVGPSLDILRLPTVVSIMGQLAIVLARALSSDGPHIQSQ